LAAGLPLVEAHQLDVLTAAVAAQSPHTINFDLDRETLAACAKATAVPLADAVRALLQRRRFRASCTQRSASPSRRTARFDARALSDFP